MPLLARVLAFGLSGLVFALAAAELGLTAYSVHRFNDVRNASEPLNRLKFLVFASAWSIVLSIVVHFLNFALSGLLIVLNVIFWLVGGGLWHAYAPSVGDCDGRRATSICRQWVAIEAIAWTLAALSIVAVGSVLFAVHGSQGRRTYRSGFHR